MRKIFLFAALIASSAVAANATTWVATCSDGKNVQYVQTLSGAGYLYLKAGKDFIQVARVNQTAATENVVCGAVKGNGDGTPLSQICMNKSRQTISLKYQAQEAGEFCAAAVTIRATSLKEH